MKKKNKEKLVAKSGSVASAVSGTVGFLGGYQVCHNTCLGLIALLSLIGITIVGMPLLFLTKVAIPFWIAAVLLFSITLIFYLRMKCISRNLLLLNGGIIIAAVPFSALKDFLIIFWVIGGSLVLASIFLLIKNKLIKDGKTN